MTRPGLEPGLQELKARADLRFALRDGKTRLIRSYAEPPLQVQRALYRDESAPDMAFLYLLNPTPGLFQGDVQTTQVHTGISSRVQLTTPSATKLFAMPDRAARQEIILTLEADSYLEYLPEPVIPFRGAWLTQRTWVSLAPGAVLVLGEVLLPGRMARGECFAFRQLDRRITVAGPEDWPLFHESSLLTPATLAPVGRGLLNAGYPVSGSVVIAAQGRDTSQLAARLRQNLAAAAAEMGSACQMALSTLPAHAGLILRLHSRDAQSASHVVRSAAETVRSEFASPQLQ